MLKVIKDMLAELEVLTDLEQDLMLVQGDIPAAYEVGLDIRELQQELIERLLEISGQVQKSNHNDNEDLH